MVNWGTRQWCYSLALVLGLGCPQGHKASPWPWTVSSSPWPAMALALWLESLALALWPESLALALALWPDSLLTLQGLAHLALFFELFILCISTIIITNRECVTIFSHSGTCSNTRYYIRPFLYKGIIEILVQLSVCKFSILSEEIILKAIV